MADQDTEVKQVIGCLNGEQYVGTDPRKAGGPAKIVGAQAFLRIDAGVSLSDPDKVFLEGCLKDGMKKLEPIYGRLAEKDPISWTGNAVILKLVMPTNASLFFTSAVCLGSINGGIEKLRIAKEVKGG